MKFSEGLSDAFDRDESDHDLDEEFPLGDGTADMDALVTCPYCGQPVEITLDPGSGDDQEYVEDCEVCSQPWRVSVTYDGGGEAHVSISALDQ